MNLPAETIAKIQKMQSNLVAIDPIFRRFCEHHRYTISSFPDCIWPRRRAWRRNEIDRAFDLTMDLSVLEFHDRGFYPEMPWSLHVSGSTHPGPDVRILTVEIFRGVAFSMISQTLQESLEFGLRILDSIKADSVIARGQPI